MITNILKSVIRTILGMFLLAAAVMFSSGIVPSEDVKQKTESVNAESSEAAYAVEIGGQCAPRNSGAGIALSPPIGGTEVPKPELPSSIAITADGGDQIVDKASSYDIGGNQSVPRPPRDGVAMHFLIGGVEVPRTKLPVSIRSIGDAEDTNVEALSSDIGGQSAPRSPSGLVVYTPIGGTEVPKPRLPRATNAGIATVDIGGTQTAPRDRGGLKLEYSQIKNIGHEHS